MAVFGRREPAEGDELGPYVLDAKLGEGATGTVHRAVRRADGLEVAIKILRRNLSSDPTYLARFRREARVAAEVRHRHLVPVVDHGEAAGVLFLASDFRSGGSLADLIATDGRLPLADCVRLAAQIASGIDALHKREIVHRDIKPSNVMLDRAGSAAVTDFGLARGHAFTVLTKPGQVLGTVDYLAPELVEGRTATPASDVYALGCLLYECATGTTPFGERRSFDVAVAHVTEEPPDPRGWRDALSEELAWTLLRALAKDPAQRPPTALAYANLLAVASSR